jgi:hypothetical protein
MTTDEIRKMLEGEGSDLSDLKKYEAYRWFIESNGKIVGNVSLKNISHMMNYAEIGSTEQMRRVGSPPKELEIASLVRRIPLPLAQGRAFQSRSSPQGEPSWTRDLLS